ncbi:MAG: ferritin-like domain-containing protein [Chitinophagaceae bacterium]|nr:ferritin-like domain-containing protein [Chitinophagaceae bacterium]
MKQKQLADSPHDKRGDNIVRNMQRRKFFSQAAGLASIAAFAAACDKDDNNNSGGVDLGSGDFGILNYAYALEQLEAAFYTQVVATPYSGMSAVELTFMTDIRNHEIAHREFFKAALGGMAIQALEVDFSTINFTNRDSVLATAKAFEDLGVTAYDGAGYLIKDANYLLLAGKIVSVEARHAALIRELIAANTFLGDQVDSNSVNLARTPDEVLSIAGTYIKTKINASNLPKG